MEAMTGERDPIFYLTLQASISFYQNRGVLVRSSASRCKS